MVVGEKLTHAQCNFSHQDQIWKDYVMKEIKVSKKRDRDYSFLLEEYKTLQKDVFELRAKYDRHSGPAKMEKPSPTTAVAGGEETDGGVKLPPLEAPPQDSSNPFPMVTSREIGWRSARKYNLEVFGRWGKPKHSILNQLKWPVDAVP